MFDISFLLFSLLLIYGIIVLLVWRSNTPLAEGFKIRLVMLLGTILVLGSYFFQPWLEFDFLGYVNLTPVLLNNILPTDLIEFIIPCLKNDYLNSLLRVITVITTPNGWQIELIPTYSVITRIATILPLLPAVLGLIWTPIGATYRGVILGRAIGFLIITLGCFSAVGLLLSLPEIDALGYHYEFQVMVLAALLGIRLGSGPWLTLLGLALLILGGRIECTDQSKVYVQ